MSGKHHPPEYYRTAKRELASYRAPAIIPSWLN